MLITPGETIFPGWRVLAATIKPEQMDKEGSDYIAYLNPDESGNRLTVRSRKTGDRYQPLGMSQPKKLGEYMIDEKIPRAWRQRIPIVCSSRYILWVVGWRIDERVKVTPETKQVLRLEFTRTPDM